jgi:hypothetical protein
MNFRKIDAAEAVTEGLKQNVPILPGFTRKTDAPATLMA